MCSAQLQSCRGGWKLVVAPLADPEHTLVDRSVLVVISDNAVELFSIFISAHSH